MSSHPALTSGRTAVITGAAGGIGLAAAERLAQLGMKICLADVNAASLDAARAAVARITSHAEVLAVPTDVSRRDEVEHLKAKVYDAFGEIAFLISNAGVEGGGKLFDDPDGLADDRFWHLSEEPSTAEKVRSLGSSEHYRRALKST